MIGLVIVSHSHLLAQGVRDLALQMTQGQAHIAAAGGIDDAENPLGTDAVKVAQAIETVANEGDVLVLMDLGSALLSAETALELLPPDVAKRVTLCAAPLVEGALAAAVQATLGSPMDVVCAEARKALRAKYAQLGETIEGEEQARTNVQVSWQQADSRIDSEQADSLSDIVQVRIPQGLHLRPAAQFVMTASQYQANIQVHNLTTGQGPANAKSIGQVTTLGARYEHQIEIHAQGSDAKVALRDLVQLVEGQNAEQTANGVEQTQTDVRVSLRKVNGLLNTEQADSLSHTLSGIPVAPGVALGPAFVYRRARLKAATYAVENVEAEITHLQAALNTAKQALDDLHAQMAHQLGSNEADIFEAQRLYLEDPELINSAQQRLKGTGENAEMAWEAVITTQADLLRQANTAYIRARAADVEDVGQHVLNALKQQRQGTSPTPSTSTTETALTPSKPSVLITDHLTTAEVANLDPEKVLGLCTARGGALSHAAILARALNIPTVAGLGIRALHITTGTELALDGERGTLTIKPDAAQRHTFKQQQHAQRALQAEALAEAHEPAVTRDGHPVKLVANVSSVAETQRALAHGAEGVGVLRTEFLYLGRVTAPDEAEQATCYRAIADVLGTRPLTIRTFDIGGDKPLPYINTLTEANPFLGQRGIRLSLQHPDLLATQLRAILRISPSHHIKIMFPMVATPDEVHAAREILNTAQEALRADGVPYADNIAVGIMIEIPAAALMIKQLAREVDFFSLGTNDLGQYTYAADRGNPHVNALADALNPAVLRLIQLSVSEAQETDTPISLCGEIGSDPVALPILLGLGLSEFSLTPAAIPQIKQCARQISLAETRDIAKHALQLPSAASVRAYVQKEAHNI